MQLRSGHCLRKGVKVTLSTTAGTKNLIHELAHEILHQVEKVPLDNTFRELEAEAVAYVVGRHFGLEGLSSPNYMALHGADAKMILMHLERIKNISIEIIEVL